MLKKKVSQNNALIGYLQNIAAEESSKNQFVLHYLSPLLHHGLGTILRHVKSKGFSSFDILGFLTLLPFLGLSSISSCYIGELSLALPFGKDVLYRFKNNQWIPWRALLFSVGRRFLKLGAKGDCAKSEAEHPKCLIFDDTDIHKTGKAIEGVSKIWSHSTHRFVLGFKGLFCVFYDGISAIPIDFSLHREQQNKGNKQYGLTAEERQKQFRGQREAQSAAAQRKAELDESKISQVLSMIKRAVKNGFKAQFVLTDTWFFCEVLLRLVVKMKMTLVSGVKMGKLTFSYQGKTYSPKALLKIATRKAKYCRKLKIHYIPLIVSYKGIEVKIFFVRYGRQKKWRIILCSDTKLRFHQVLKIYQIRWSIEVFFKEMKQYLGMEKCQSRNFNAHIAHLTLGCMTYLALALKKRSDNHQTLGQLFRSVKSDLIELTIAQRVWKWFLKIVQELTDLFDVEPKVLFHKMAQPTVYRTFQFNFLE